VRLAALEPEGSPWDQQRWEAALDPYWDEFEWMRIDQVARASEFFDLTETPEGAEVLEAFGVDNIEDVPVTSAGDRNWWVSRQIIADPDDTGAWRLTCVLDVPATLDSNQVVLRTAAFGALN
jgi:hypothetical protein